MYWRANPLKHQNIKCYCNGTFLFDEFINIVIKYYTFIYQIPKLGASFIAYRPEKHPSDIMGNDSYLIPSMGTTVSVKVFPEKQNN